MIIEIEIAFYIKTALCRLVSLSWIIWYIIICCSSNTIQTLYNIFYAVLRPSISKLFQNDFANISIFRRVWWKFVVFNPWKRVVINVILQWRHIYYTNDLGRCSTCRSGVNMHGLAPTRRVRRVPFRTQRAYHGCIIIAVL
jgi:hypothetical protein